MAISVTEIALNSRTFPEFSKAAAARLLSRSGASTAKIRIAVSRSRRILFAIHAPRHEIFHLIRRHRLPPIRVEHVDLAPQCPQHPLLTSRLLRTYDVGHRHTPAADGHRLSIFNRLNQLRQLVLGIGYADLHVLIIAI